MESGTSEWTVVMDRLEKLEKQNHRMRQMGVLALILLGSVLLIGQAAPQKTIEANEFVLKDKNGKQRAGLSFVGGVPGFHLSDAAGNVRAELIVDASGPSLGLFDSSGNVRFMLAQDSRGTILTLDGPARKTNVTLSALSEGAQFVVSDPEDFKATIGTTDIETTHTGERSQTSAASVILTGKGKVIWQAP